MSFYSSMPYADQYIEPHPIAGKTWKSLSLEDRTHWITYAEQQIDAQEWLGSPVDSTQDHAFPRNLSSAAMQLTDWDHVSPIIKSKIAEDEWIIPSCIQKAVCEIIIYGLQSASLEKLQHFKEKGIVDMQVGSASFQFSDSMDPDKSNPPLPKKAWRLVRHLSLIHWTKKSPIILERI